MNIHPIKAFKDNYIWVIERGKEAVIVDPGESEGVLNYFQGENVKLAAILLTHNHEDHIGGVKDILDKYPDTLVYGPEETKSLNSHTITEDDTFELFNQDVEVIHTPGHTMGHISYIIADALFCGDALFSAGTGRVFTEDYQVQFDTLQKFKHLDDAIKVYPAHEYTVTNLRFSQMIKPMDNAITKALQEANRLREADKPTLPSTIKRERKINLLLQAPTLDDFKSLRLARDEFS